MKTWIDKRDCEMSYKIKTIGKKFADITDCLLYTSDAADDVASVDLGGRRIIKKIF